MNEHWTVLGHHVECFRRDDFDYVALVDDVRAFLAQKSKGNPRASLTVISLSFESHLGHDQCSDICRRGNGISATLVWEKAA